MYIRQVVDGEMIPSEYKGQTLYPSTVNNNDIHCHSYPQYCIIVIHDNVRSLNAREAAASHIFYILHFRRM